MLHFDPRLSLPSLLLIYEDAQLTLITHPTLFLPLPLHVDLNTDRLLYTREKHDPFVLKFRFLSLFQVKIEAELRSK
jgi:hypothetical protein